MIRAIDVKAEASFQFIFHSRSVDKFLEVEGIEYMATGCDYKRNFK